MDLSFYHRPVMVNEISDYLITSVNGYYADCTFGGGGHSFYLLNKYKNIKIIAFDQDEDSFEYFIKNENFKTVKDRIIFCKDNFKNILKNLSDIKIDKVNGLFADLGVSSKQLDNMSRGFSFNSDELLDMRMDQSQKLTAYEVINTFSEEKLKEIFFEYGEESFSRQIAGEISDYRLKGTIKTCSQLKDIISRVKRPKGKIDPSTKVFQSLRIYVNDELGSLRQMLNSIPQILSKGSRAAILTYHSLEDRIVKQTFKSFHDQGLKVVNKKVIIASSDEIKTNPRSRSAKLRVIEKII